MSERKKSSNPTRLQCMRVWRHMWILRGVLASVATHPLFAAADHAIEFEFDSIELREPTALHSINISASVPKPNEILSTDNFDAEPTNALSNEPDALDVRPITTASIVVDGLKMPLALSKASVGVANVNASPVRSAEPEKSVVPEQGLRRLEVTKSLKPPPVYFSDDVPRSEILRVRQTFHGLVHETMRFEPHLLSNRYLGSLAGSESISDAKLAELESTLLDESFADYSYALGREVKPELTQLDPNKTYTVVDGRIHSVTPTEVKQPIRSEIPSTHGAKTSTEVASLRDPLKRDDSGHALASADHASVAKSIPSLNAAPLNLPSEEIARGISQVFVHQSSAALESTSAEPERVTIQGRVVVPAGFARDRVVLRMAGTPFQVQTDSSGGFELRDVPRGTRFELLVWHLDGSLTRRLVPLTASGREKVIEIALQKISEVDALAGSFGVLQHMNRGGFCARVESQSPVALLGGRVVVVAEGKNLQAHYFSDSGLPSTSQSDLSSDGRFCVFNIDESLVDVKVTLVNGTRRQFSLHIEPSIFEHDLVLDVVESVYRRVSLLEPLDAQQAFDLSNQNIQPDFGDRRLRSWLQGGDVPIWTRVGRFLLQSDPAYAMVRPNSEDVQYFPGGQEFVELRVASHVEGARWSRVVLSKDDLFTDSILKKNELMKGGIYQDRETLMSLAAIDTDAWEEMSSYNADISQLGADSSGGVYISIDPSGLKTRVEDLVISVRDTWSGKDVCRVVPLGTPEQIKVTRFIRAACSSRPGQYALIIETKEGALLWSDVVRIRSGDVQTLTVLDPKF